MVTIQETELRQEILAAIGRAKELSQSVLVSEVQKIERFDPFIFFAAGRERFVGERFFWSNPNGSHILAGLGVANQFHSERAEGRFREIADNWKDLLDTSVTIGKLGAAGTGAVIFGGFSFDPLKKQTELWSKFSHALFHIPAYMLTVHEDEVYLTTNIICTQHDDASLFEKVIAERRALMASQNEGNGQSLPFLESFNEVAPEEWKQTVANVVGQLKQSALKKVVLAREVRLAFTEDIPVEPVLKHLISEQRESYIFALEANGDCFIGASPERLVKKEQDAVFSACLAGSIGRSENTIEDEQLGQELLKDEKNLIEHQYVVDMIKAAMLDTCDKVELPGEPILMKTKYIQHLYTPVKGKNRAGTTILDLVERLHPTPALGGLPSQAAIEKIRSVEQLDRGFYASPIGWTDASGNGEFAVAIRSGLLQGCEASLFAGCGIVSDSDPESEYVETSIKFRPMLTALGGMHK